MKAHINMPSVEITSPDEIEISNESFSVGCYDYSTCHIVYNNNDLGSIREIKENMILLEKDNNSLRAELENYIKALKNRNEIISKLVNQDKLDKSDKKFLSKFKRRNN